MTNAGRELKAGDRVSVPWGLGQVEATIIEVWGDPPAHVRVRLDGLAAGEDESPPVILLTPSVLDRAA